MEFRSGCGLVLVSVAGAIVWLVWGVLYAIKTFAKWLITPAGAFLLFMGAGVAIASWALRTQPSGMEGNLVGEIAGAFFGAAAVDGVLMMLARHQRRRGYVALAVESMLISGGYDVRITNSGPQPLFNIRLHGPYPDWRWREPSGTWTRSLEARTFADGQPQIAYLEGAIVELEILKPIGRLHNLPHSVSIDWNDTEGNHFVRRILLHDQSPWDS